MRDNRQGKLKKEALPVVNDEQLRVEKQKSLHMAFERTEYERLLTTLQQNARGYISDVEDYHDQIKSKLSPFVSRDRASRNNDDHQQPNTYVAGEIYNDSHVLSDQFRPIQTVGEEIEKDKTTDDNISLTRNMLRIIVSNALEEQKKLADVNIADAIKLAFSDGIKKGSVLGHLLDQTPIDLHQPTELQTGHLLSPSQTGNTGRPSSVINVPVQSVSKLPVNAINSGLDGNKTLDMMSSFNTGKRYKRETTLKFSEGFVETYESFRSQFNIHRKMLGWDDHRTAVELYMSLEGKATLKV